MKLPEIPVTAAALVIPICAHETVTVVALVVTGISTWPWLLSAKLTLMPTLVMAPEALASVMDKPEYAVRSNVVQATSVLVALSWTWPKSVSPKPAELAPMLLAASVPEKVQDPFPHFADTVLASLP
jgi:hypothetical protein